MKTKTNLFLAVIIALFAINLKAQVTAIANKVLMPKIIDGNISEWNFPSGFQEGTTMQTVNASWPWVPQDNKLFWKATWDNSYLYLAIIVQDAYVVPYVDGSKGDYIVFSFGSNVNNTGGWGPEATNWGGMIFVPADGNTTAIQGEIAMETVIKKSADALGNGVGGYIVEVKIPWATFGETPSIGKQYLFNVEAHDYDQYFEGGVWQDNPGYVNELGWATYDNGWGSMANAGRLNLAATNPDIDVIVTEGDITIDANTTVKSLTVAPGAKVTILGTNTLTATNGITLQSNSSATATLVDNYENPTITATVQQYLPQGRNWYLGSPIETNIANTGNLTGAGATSVSYYSEQYGWQNGYTGNLAEGVGYIAVSAAGSNTTNISFTGKLNSGDVPITLTKKGSSFAGYNLIANPYPSYINPMPAINANTNLDGTIWYRTKGTSYKFETVNTTSGVGTNAAGTGMVTGYIPPMQAFWVKTNVDMQPFTFTNTMRDHARNVTVGAGTVPTTPLKAKKQESISLMRLIVTGNSGSDEAVLYFDANASNAFDKYDSHKMFESSTAITPEIYTSVGNEKLVINGFNTIPYDVEIPLGFIAKQTGDYSISRTEMSNFEVGTCVILKDKLQPNTETELSEGVAYNFSSQTTATTDRFSLLFRAPETTTGVITTVKRIAQVVVNASNQITIIAPEKSTYYIYNAVGILLENGILNYKLHTINCKLNSGVYFVHVSSNGQSEIQKVIIR